MEFQVDTGSPATFICLESLRDSSIHIDKNPINSTSIIGHECPYLELRE